ncbi:MAG: NAD-dependent epimerase/dehydratase family protein [Candidatus Aenigmarchaeota archaeon]|nr:NAD-dependent epimerase/dehydratase family protein [Candidatus Aenigmarchaeota archaeon]
MVKKILITGASGFIGSALSEKLGTNELVLLNKVGGANGILDPGIDKLFESVDIVVHLAALGNYAGAKLEDFMKINCDGTVNVLEAAKTAGIKKFIFASTGLVYGKPVKLPITEEHPLNPVNPYEMSKAAAEVKCRSYSEFFDVSIFRFSNVYGNNGTKSVVYKFLHDLANNRRSKIVGGEQRRDFVHIEDVVGLVAGCTDRTAAGVFNVCFGKSYSVNEVYAMAEKISGTLLEPERVAGADCSYQFSNFKAQKLLGFYPKIDLKKGMEMIWEDLK